MDIQLQQHVDGPYVEFNLAGSADAYTRQHESSYFLDNYVFAIFAGSFAAVNDQFDPHGATPFTPAQLPQLWQTLAEQQAALAAIMDDEQFRATIEGYNGHYFMQMLINEQRDYVFEWPALWLKLLAVNAGLMALVDQCREGQQTLWVLGL